MLERRHGTSPPRRLPRSRRRSLATPGTKLLPRLWAQLPTRSRLARSLSRTRPSTCTRRHATRSSTLQPTRRVASSLGRSRRNSKRAWPRRSSCTTRAQLSSRQPSLRPRRPSRTARPTSWPRSTPTRPGPPSPGARRRPRSGSTRRRLPWLRRSTTLPLTRRRPSLWTRARSCTRRLLPRHAVAPKLSKRRLTKASERLSAPVASWSPEPRSSAAVPWLVLASSRTRLSSRMSRAPSLWPRALSRPPSSSARALSL
mmetsp:Transcript_28913/g.66854  ORF Transcript_28913/g.66854 Transcript_28913/m.66854 type:complete len:257 (+) Transcript_28913:3863-4633(+)